jgi:hypothetical protein
MQRPIDFRPQEHGELHGARHHPAPLHEAGQDPPRVVLLAEEAPVERAQYPLPQAQGHDPEERRHGQQPSAAAGEQAADALVATPIQVDQEKREGDEGRAQDEGAGQRVSQRLADDQADVQDAMDHDRVRGGDGDRQAQEQENDSRDPEREGPAHEAREGRNQALEHDFHEQRTHPDQEGADEEPAPPPLLGVSAERLGEDEGQRREREGEHDYPEETAARGAQGRQEPRGRMSGVERPAGGEVAEQQDRGDREAGAGKEGGETVGRAELRGTGEVAREEPEGHGQEGVDPQRPQALQAPDHEGGKLPLEPGRDQAAAEGAGDEQEEAAQRDRPLVASTPEQQPGRPRDEDEHHHQVEGRRYAGRVDGPGQGRGERGPEQASDDDEGGQREDEPGQEGGQTPHHRPAIGVRLLTSATTHWIASRMTVASIEYWHTAIDRCAATRPMVSM